jgi:hypothetical protein
MTAVGQTEMAFLELVAERYRRQGFEVAVSPAPGSLPEALRTFVPDLLAQKGNERVVVQIKRRSGAPSGEQLSALAEAVAREPGWRLEVVLFEPPSPPESLPSAHLILSTVKDAENLYHANQRNAALLLAWSALEAAGKSRLQGDAPHRAHAASPLDLLKTLVSLGVLEESDYRNLIDVAQLRNRVAHGTLDNEIRPDQFARLTAVARSLVRADHDAAA